MALALSSSVFAFQAPAMRAVVQQPAASMNANRNMADSMIGKYSLTQIVCMCHAQNFRSNPLPIAPSQPSTTRAAALGECGRAGRWLPRPAPSSRLAYASAHTAPCMIISPDALSQMTR